MANPSLQIGNSNWAIKEDNLLGYSTAGTRFVPQPITMTRESAGTRVNSSGLVETVELLGSEDVRDGNFLLTGTQAQNTTGTYWTTRTGWTISGGSANIDGSQSAESGLIQSSVFTSGKTYKLSFNITSNGAAIKFWVNGSQNIFSTSLVDGLIEYTFTASATGSAYFEATSTFIGSISNVSVKEYTANNLARVDYDGTASSLLVEPERTNLITYSSDFSDSIWTKLAAGSGIAPIITSDYSISPSGTQTADRIQFNLNGGTGGGDTSYINTSLSAGTINASASIYLKTNDNTTKDITLRLGAGLFDYDVTVTSEWQRFSLLGNTNVDRIQLLLYGNKNSQTADLSVWGVQVEEGSYATSYIPTDGGTVTRVQDQYSKTGISNLINSEEGVLFVEMAALSDDGTDRRITLSDGSVSDQVIIGLSRFASNINAEIHSGGVLQTSGWGGTGVTQTNNNKFAISWGSGTMKFYINGSPISPQTGITSPM